MKINGHVREKVCTAVIWRVPMKRAMLHMLEEKNCIKRNGCGSIPVYDVKYTIMLNRSSEKK